MIPPLVDLLTTPPLQPVVTAVLCNMSDRPPVSAELAATPGAVGALVSLLDTEDVDIQSRAAVILADLGASGAGCKDGIAAEVTGYSCCDGFLMHFRENIKFMPVILKRTLPV